MNSVVMRGEVWIGAGARRKLAVKASELPPGSQQEVCSSAGTLPAALR